MQTDFQINVIIAKSVKKKLNIFETKNLLDFH